MIFERSSSVVAASRDQHDRVGDQRLWLAVIPEGTEPVNPLETGCLVIHTQLC
jgi:hypothetical protein